MRFDANNGAQNINNPLSVLPASKLVDASAPSSPLAAAAAAAPPRRARLASVPDAPLPAPAHPPTDRPRRSTRETIANRRLASHPRAAPASTAPRARVPRASPSLARARVDPHDRVDAGPVDATPRASDTARDIVVRPSVDRPSVVDARRETRRRDDVECEDNDRRRRFSRLVRRVL